MQDPDASTGEKVKAGAKFAFHAVKNGVTAGVLFYGGARCIVAIGSMLLPAAETAGTAACADGDCTNEIEGAVDTYDNLRKLTSGTGLEAHHIIEQRFAGTLGLDPGQMQSIALTSDAHQVFTNMWSSSIGHDTWHVITTTSTATIEDIWVTAQQVYANHPELLEIARQTIFGQ